MTSSTDLSEESVGSDSRYRTVNLLRECRKVKKQLHEIQLQNFKDEMASKLMEEEESLQIGYVDLYTKMVEVTDKMDEAVKTIQQTNSDKSKSTSDKPKYISTSPRVVNASKSQETPHLPRVKKLKRQSPFTPVVRESLLPTLNYERVDNFNEIIESIAKLYKIPSEEEFTSNYSQLIDTLDVLKNYKTSVESLTDMEQRFKEMVATKTEMDELFQLDSLKTQLLKIKINEQTKNNDD